MPRSRAKPPLWVFMLLVACSVDHVQFVENADADVPEYDAARDLGADDGLRDGGGDVSACESGETRGCEGFEGECGPGTQHCEAGIWGECQGRALPSRELCTPSGHDEDCDGSTDEDCDCTPGRVERCGSFVGICGPGQHACEADGHWAECVPTGAAALETCNDLDDDCDGMTDEMVRMTWFEDGDGDGFGNLFISAQVCGVPDGDWVSNSGDCDDHDATRFPDAPDRCDGVNADCDALIDENPLSVWYPDLDGDGFGDETAPSPACEQPAGMIALGGDCDDTTDVIHPDASEICDRRDNNCDGYVDEGEVCSADCQPREWGSSVYLLCTTERTQQAASEQCGGYGEGGYALVTLTDVLEQLAVDGMATTLGVSSWWIGLNDREPEGVYVWESGEPFAFSAWAADQPSAMALEDCVQLGESGGLLSWSDEDCEAVAQYICEGAVR